MLLAHHLPLRGVWIREYSKTNDKFTHFAPKRSGGSNLLDEPLRSVLSDSPISPQPMRLKR